MRRILSDEPLPATALPRGPAGLGADPSQALRFLEDGRIRPLVGAGFALRDAAQARCRVQSGGKIGKVVLQR